MYTLGGFVSAELYKPDRKPFASGTLGGRDGDAN